MRICILTPDPADPAFEGRWSEVRDRMVAPLAAEGARVESRPWVEEPTDLRPFDLVLPLVTWGYHRAHDQWVRRCREWRTLDVRILNPPSVLEWNADKLYLERLYELGAPVIPTVFVDRVAEADLAALAGRFGSEVLIVKPQVSASAYQTLRVRPGDPLAGAPDGRAMVQPYLDAVEGEGELSLIFFSGAFSHAIRKVAAPGDFRVQPEWGGRISAYDPPADVRAAAEAILAAVEEPLLYARVDMVRDASGRPMLMELELVEPDLYLQHDAAGGRTFVEAVRSMARHRTTPAGAALST